MTDRERWEALIDREAIGEALSADEQAFVAAYEGAHPQLADERAIVEAAIESLRERLEAPQDPAALDQAAAAALARHRSFSGEARPTPRWAWALSLAAAAGLALWAGARLLAPSDAHEDPLGLDEARRPLDGEAPTTDRPDRPEPRPVDPVGRLSMRSPAAGALELGLELGLAFGPGERFSELPGATEVERACVSWSAPTAVVCFEGDVGLAAPELGQRRLRLASGRLVAALDPLGPGQRFTVDTRLGSVSAIGTVFAVELHEGGVWVTVLDGQVELRDPTVRTLAAGQRTAMRGEVAGDEPTPLPADAIPSALEQLVGVAELLRARPGEARAIVPATGELPLRLDGHLLAGPAALALAPGEYALTFEGDEHSVTLEVDGVVDLAAPLEGQLEAPSDGASSAGKPGPSKAAADPSASWSAKQLAEAAQRKREAKDYQETARLYRELLRRFPDSPEAAAIPVRLGDLLASTSDHEGALAAYDLYLRRGAKQLAPEAELGRIAALRALGRTAEEREAIEAYLAAHPDDHRVPELRSRL
jgi:hypothetical protein